MKLIKTASGKKTIKMSKKEWESIGEKAGWRISQIINDDGFADGGEPYTDEEMDDIDDEQKNSTFSYGTTPESIIDKKALEQTPDGYPITIKNNNEWKTIAKAVNQGIDSHLEGFTRSTFDSKTGKILIHPSEMKTLLRRLLESEDSESISLRMDILATLGIEEI